MTTDLHLSELAANNYLLGECSEASARAIEAHVANCSDCAGYLDDLRTFDASLPVTSWIPTVAPPLATGLPDRASTPVPATARHQGAPVGRGAATAQTAPSALDQADDLRDRPPPTRVAATEHNTLHPPSRPPAPRTQAQSRVRLRWVLTAAALTAAAAVMLVLPRTPPEDVRVKGGEFALEVFAKGDDRPREVGDGDIVHPGERLGFRVRSDGGYVLIAGVDQAGNAYPCYPPTGAAEAIEAASDPVVLNGAVELDGALGSERIVAVQCAAPFAFEDVVTTLQADADAPLPLLRSGCAQREIVLEKRTRLSP